MTISKSNLHNAIGIILLYFFIFTVDFRTSLFGSVLIAYSVALLAIIEIYRGAKVHLSSHIPIPLLLWVISLGWVVSTLNTSYIIKYILGLLLLYCYYTKKGAGKYTVNGLVAVGLIFSMATFLFYFEPNIYLNHIVPRLASYLQETAVIMMRTNRYPGLTGHYSTNGTYLAVGFGAVLSLSLIQRHRKENRIRYFMMCFLVLGALLLIGKRAHLVFSVAAAFGVYWFCNDREKINRFIKLIGVLIVGSILIVIIINQIPALSNTFNRFVETANSGDFLMSRGKFYSEAFIQFKRSPLLGCGWRTMMNILDHDVHNIYIQILSETGIVGFVFFGGLFVYGIRIAIKTLKYTGVSKTILSDSDRLLIYFSSYYMFFFILYGFTGNPLYDEQPFYIFMVAYGILMHYEKNVRTVK